MRIDSQTQAATRGKRVHDEHEAIHDEHEAMRTKHTPTELGHACIDQDACMHARG